MTLLLITESHGEVKSGFFSMYTQFTRLGEYCFATKHFYELAQHIASNSNIRNGQILAYDLNKFWEEANTHISERAQIILEAGRSYLPELQKYERDREMKKMQS